MITLKSKCPQCGAVHDINVELKDYNDYQTGKHPQDAFPYLDAGQREMLISGICPECWERLFPEEDE